MLNTFRRDGYEAQAVENGEQALEILAHRPVDLAVTDLGLSGMDGMEVLRSVKRMSPETEVVVMTASGAIEGAVEAIKGGAYDYLTKPFQPQELTIMARRALERKGLAEKVRALEQAMRGRHSFEGIIGTSPAVTDVLKMVEQVARLDATVLISGESGTGKELVARALHAFSPRKDKPLVIINCGAIPENLRESELFGHTKGAFTGAHLDKRGLFEEAHEGTAFLDEVGELTAAAQVKMLRFLQNGEVRRVGTTVSRNLDVRIIAATNRDLEKCVEENTFREDLYYRLNVIPIHLPPLRERTEDIPLLAQHFVRAAAERSGNVPPAISPRAMSALIANPWKGNVRELEDVTERAIALDRDGVIGLDDLPFADSERAADKILDGARSNSLTLSELEREYILEILAECGGSRKKTAEKLGITTATLWRKLKRYEKGD
jgi:DNA-binding NtrC family response regulator